MVEEQSARFWKAAARSLARRVNLGWWSEHWMVWVMSVGLLGAVAVLLERWKPMVTLPWVWGIVGGLLVIGGIVAWLAVRPRLESAAAARIRLEDALGLKARLSAAEAGIGPWPTPVEPIAWPVSWRWEKLATVIALAGAMLLLAAYIPITPAAEARHIIEKPSSVKDVEKWVEKLRKENAVDQKSLDDLEKKIADLLQRPSQNWYEHGSLEAADNLKEQTQGELRRMADNLADAQRAASALQAMGETAPEAVKQALAEGLSAAARDLQSSGIKPNEDTLKDLNDVTGKSGLSGMTQDQIKDLAKKLRENEAALQQALKDSPGFDSSNLPIAQNGKHGEGENGDENGPDGDGDPGKGGINRGRGDAPMAFSKDANDLNTKDSEALPSNLDVQRIAPGDTVATSNGKHKVDEKAYSGPKQGGALQHAGDGGSAVWQNSLVPAERDALKKYFK